MELNNNKPDFSKSDFTEDVKINDSNTYKGYHYNKEGKIIPHGWGRFRNDNGDIIQGYFIDGRIGKAAIKAYKG